MDSKLYKQVGDLAKKWAAYPNEYNPNDAQNRTILVEKNLRLAVDTALKYRGLGLDEDELISAASYGLCLAYDKYNPQNNKLRSELLAAISEQTTCDEFVSIVSDKCTYGNLCDKMFANPPQTYDEMVAWIDTNIKPTAFANYAYFWIRAVVLQEVSKYRDPLYIADKYRQDGQFTDIGSVAPYLAVKDTDEDYEDNCSKLYEGVDVATETMIMMRHGIGCDGKMTYQQIADEVGLTAADVRERITEGIARMKDNIAKYGLQLNWFLPN